MPIPQGGTTPGALNNTTAGSYPFMFGDPTTGILGILDSLTYGVPNPVPIATGLNPNGNLNLGGFGITNASTGSFSGAITIGGTLGVTGITTLTGGVASPLLIGAGLLNTVTIAGKATGTDPTITVAGDATRSVNLVAAAASTTAFAGLNITNSAGGGPVFLGSFSTAGYGALWLGTAEGSLSALNATLYGNGGNTILQATGNLELQAGSTNQVLITTAGFFINNVPVVQNTAATALTLKGNAAATGSTGAIVLSNQTQQTTGVTLAVQNPTGTSIATVDFAGSFVSASGKFGATTAAGNVRLVLTGNDSAGGIACQVIANTDVTGTGFILELQSNSAAQFGITGRGHLIPLSTAPAVGTFAAGYNTPTAVTTTGGDASFRINFTTGAAAVSISIGTALMVITLNQAYSAAATANAIASYASGQAAAAGDVAPIYAEFTGAGQITLYAAAGFTPQSSHAYSISVFTMGAGATS
jgi:fibronectin-binding autotransporter adhesin